MIDALRRERQRLISITPVRTSLEAYFVGSRSCGAPKLPPGSTV